MLELPKIAEISYEEAMQDYINRISLKSGDWRNCGEGSTGIALLELFTYILNIQRGNMNKISENSVIAMAKLFALQREELRPAESSVSVTGLGRIPCGEKFLVGNMVFETQNEVLLDNNNCCAVGKTENTKIVMQNYGNMTDNAITVFENGIDFIIGLVEAPLSNKTMSFTLLFDEDGRNPITDKDSFIQYTCVEWQYYGEESGIIGWHQAEIISDETFNCMISGEITCKINGEPVKQQNMFLLRAYLKRDCFDKYPVLRSVKLNCIKIKQTDTKCCYYDFSYNDFITNKMFFSCGFGNSIEHTLFIKTAGSYILAEEAGVYSEVLAEDCEKRLVTSDHEIIKDFAGDSIKSDDIILRLCIYEYGYIREFLSLGSRGLSNQQFRTDFSGVLGNSMKLMVGEYKNGQCIWDEWVRTDNIQLCASADKVYELHDEEGLIVFGDNEHGRIPPADNGNKNIRVISMKISEGAKGNLPKGREIKLNRGNNIIIDHFTEAQGGQDKEKIKMLIQRMMESTKNRVLVTKQDYVKASMSTQGIILKNAAAMEGKKRNGTTRSNSVMVVIEPRYHRNGFNCEGLEWYMENVKRKLEKYKPVTTHIKVIFPKYVPVYISVSIIPKSTRFGCEIEVKQCISDYFDKKCDIGATLNYSDIYNELDMLDGVSKVKHLEVGSVHMDAKTDEQGNVIIPPEGKALLNDCKIEIVDIK